LATTSPKSRTGHGPTDAKTNLLVLNGGFGGEKACVFRLPDHGAPPPEPPIPLWESDTDFPAGTDAAARATALTTALPGSWTGPDAVLTGPAEIHAIGHRVVHGGLEFRESVRITPDVMAAIERLAPLAPAHNPAALEGMAVADRLFGATVPQFAVFDTAFQRNLPDAAAVYPRPYSWAEQGLRRFGFHGINHQYVAGRTARLLGRNLPGLRLISCHLGNGCSLAAIRGGGSVDTTMGFTPLEGLMMGSRSGSLDPGLLLYLQREKGLSAPDLDRILNHESGLLGISGVSADLREVSRAIDAGSDRARLALDIYVHRLRAGIGAMFAALGGADALIFTAGVGQHSAAVRAAACETFAFAGVTLDPALNEDVTADADIVAADSAVRVLVIRAQEDWAIALECARLALR
jgi:acetate kinase